MWPAAVSCRRDAVIRSRVFFDVVAGLECAPRTGFDGVDSVFSVAGEQSVQLSSGDAVFGGRFGDGGLPDDNFQNDDAMLRHSFIRL